MREPSAERVWRGLLPAEACVSVGFADAVPLLLTATEQLSLGHVGAGRWHEFAAGRWHAKRALTELGCGGAVELSRRADGAPSWPAGVVGSIAHTRWDGRVFVVAVAARSGALAGIGVDVEPPGQVEPRAWEAMLSPAELDAVMAMAVPLRSTAVREFWCAKEAAAKAWGRPGALAELEIDRRSGIGDYVATGPRRGTAIRDKCIGRVVSDDGWACAVALRLAR